MGHIVESVNRKSKDDAARWISRQVYRNICFDTTIKEKESQVSTCTKMTNDAGICVTNFIKSKPTGLRGVTQSACRRSLQQVAWKVKKIKFRGCASLFREANWIGFFAYDS